jgi:hypothetical protein
MENKHMKSTLAATLVNANHENGAKHRLYITVWMESRHTKGTP